VDALNDRLEDVLRGVYDRGRKPDKVPRLIKGNKLQIIQQKQEPQPQSHQNSPKSTSNDTDNDNIKLITIETTTKNSTSKKNMNSGTNSSSIGPIGFSGNFSTNY
jgi:hypothetical protein